MSKLACAASATAIKTVTAGISIEQPASPIMGSDDAATYLNLSKASLAKMRCWGGGPIYIRLGRKIGYMRPDLDSWLNARRARTTSDAAERLPTRLTVGASASTMAA